MDDLISNEQLSLFEKQRAIVNYYDKAGALRTGQLIRRIKKGKHKDKYIVLDRHGKRVMPDKIRDIVTELE